MPYTSAETWKHKKTLYPPEESISSEMRLSIKWLRHLPSVMNAKFVKWRHFFRHLWRHNYVISDVNNLKIYKILQHNVIHVFANFYSYGYCWTYYTSVKCLKLLSGLQITNVLNLVCKMSKFHDKIIFFIFMSSRHILVFKKVWYVFSNCCKLSLWEKV